MTNQKIRETFEKWAKRRGLDLVTHKSDWSGATLYSSDNIQYMWEGYQAALASVPEGWKLVPVEPTETMELRGAEATHGIDWGDSPDERPYELAVDIYKAMLDAAP